MKTGAVAPDVGKLNPGKLMKDQIAKKNTQLKENVSTTGNKVKHDNIMLDTLLYDIFLAGNWDRRHNFACRYNGRTPKG